jgi:hypothetical protein
MRIASTKTINKDFEASLSIEAHRSDGSIKRYAFTKQPLHQWTQLRDAIRLAGDEARRLEVEGPARCVSYCIVLVIVTEADLQDI